MYKRRLYTLIIIIYLTIGTILGTYVAISNSPNVNGIMVPNWNTTYSIIFADLYKGRPILVASYFNTTVVYLMNSWEKLNFESYSACILKDRLVLAGQVNSMPALAFLGLNDTHYFVRTFNISGSFTTVSCSRDLVVAGGIFPRPFVVVYNIKNVTKFYMFPELFPAVEVKVSLVNHKVVGLIRLVNGSVYLYRMDVKKANYIQILKLMNSRVKVKGVGYAPEEPLILGSVNFNNQTQGLIYILDKEEALILRTKGINGIEILSATILNNNTLRFYMRPLNEFWDGIGCILDGKVWFSRLLWPYNHIVSLYRVDRKGNFVAASILYTEKGDVLVITKGFALVPAILWSKNVPLFYVKKPSWGEAIEANITKLKLFKNVSLEIEHVSVVAKISSTEMINQFNLSKPFELSLRIDTGRLLSLSALFNLIIGVMVYEFFKQDNTHGVT